MKINKLMLALLAGAMFASCSDDRSNEPTGPDYSEVGSSGFLSVAIGMPTETVARGLNDDFADGEENEYTVSNAAILFFEGNLPNPKFARVYPISTSFNEDGEEGDGLNAGMSDYNQITAQIAATFPVDFAKESNAPLYALAVLNYSNVMSIKVVEDAQGNKTNTLEIYNQNGVLEPFAFNTEFPEFMKKVTNRSLMNDGTNFFMTNTPFSRVPGGTVQPSFNDRDNSFQVLSQVLRQNIYETAEEARQNPAAEIFVERALAKVQVQLGNGKTLANVSNQLGVGVQSITWMIDNTEPNTYIVRNLEQVGANYLPNAIPTWADWKSQKSTNYRFIGNVPLKDLSRFRVYYCANPNDNGVGYAFNEDYSDMVNVKNGAPEAYRAISTANAVNPQYCYENTFDVEHMDYYNTTRAIIKVQFASIGEGVNDQPRPFYTVGLDQTTRYIFDAAASILTRSILENAAARTAWETFFQGKGDDINKTATTADMVYSSNLESRGTAKNAWMDVTLNILEGRLRVTALKLLDGTSQSINASDEVIAEIIETVNAEHEIKAYLQSEGYFAVRIKHFGDTYTPWTTPLGPDGKPITTNTTVDSYAANRTNIVEQDQKNFLGRYGVVRNNWYVINIDAINSYGEPTAADLPLNTTPDDKSELEEAIACRINILSWAKRVQSEEL